MTRVFIAAALAFATTALSSPLTVKGSDTMVVLAQKWAEAYMKEHPKTLLQITGGGTGTGIAALLNGTTEIATASRRMSDAEKNKLKAATGASPVEIVVAKDGVAFYVNAANPVSSLTLEQLRDLYLGEVRNWSELGGASAQVTLYSRENSSGTFVFVRDELLKGEDFAPNAQTLPGTAAIVNAVAKDKNAIGYGGAAFAKGIKELAIDSGGQKLVPSLENVRSGKYPLSRDLYFYLRKAPTGELRDFIDFCLSDAGQKIVASTGYFPLK